jgi:hypothetical protein
MRIPSIPPQPFSNPNPNPNHLHLHLPSYKRGKLQVQYIHAMQLIQQTRYFTYTSVSNNPTTPPPFVMRCPPSLCDCRFSWHFLVRLATSWVGWGKEQRVDRGDGVSSGKGGVGFLTCLGNVCMYGTVRTYVGSVGFGLDVLCVFGGGKGCV